MSRSPIVVLADPNPIIRNRIRNIFAVQEIEFHEISNRTELVNILNETENRIDLIITDLEIDVKKSFDGISLIKLVKSRSDLIPVVVLTSVSRKDVIMKCLMEGAADYILKPFEDEYLKDKLLKYIDIESLTEYTVLKFNLQNYLSREIYKARKGNYNFSLLLVNFHSDHETEQEAGQGNFYRCADLIYNELNSLFWESDLYIQHGFQSHLGFFPFCSSDQTSVIRSKIAVKFQQLKTSNILLKNYSISLATVTFPSDGDSAAELLASLAERSKSTE